MGKKYIAIQIGYQWAAIPVEYLEVVQHLTPIERDYESGRGYVFKHEKPGASLEFHIIGEPEPYVDPSQTAIPDEPAPVAVEPDDLPAESMLLSTDKPAKFTPPDMREFVDEYRDGGAE